MLLACIQIQTLSGEKVYFMTELEKIDQAAEYFRRFHQMEAAIVQNHENQEYLKTYIHDEQYVLDNFDLKKQLARGLGMSAAAALVIFLILVWISLVPAIVLGAFVLIGGTVFFYAFNHYRLDEAKQNQVEVNEGITEQIEILKAREPQLIQAKDNYYEGLEKRITFMDISEMKYIDDLRKLVEDGEAENAEEAFEMLEQRILLQQFNSIMEHKEIEKVYTEEENKERFGDPLELIGKRKKSLKEKLFGRKK